MRKIASLVLVAFALALVLVLAPGMLGRSAEREPALFQGVEFAGARLDSEILRDDAPALAPVFLELVDDLGEGPPRDFSDPQRQVDVRRARQDVEQVVDLRPR